MIGVNRRRVMGGGGGEPPVDWDNEYLTFKALDSCTFNHTTFDVDYSLDGGNTWVTLAAGTNSPSVAAGKYIKFKGNIVPDSTGSGTFSSTGRYEAMGNPISLFYGDNFIGVTDLSGLTQPMKEMFYQSMNLVSSENLAMVAEKLSTQSCVQMFGQCSAMEKTVSVLSATDIGNACYQSMYRGCTALQVAPELPATRLSNFCYQYMFLGCTGLTAAPELPATSLSAYGYNGMFNGCSSLSYIKMLCTSVGNSSLTGWVNGVAASGTFVKNAAMTTLPSGANGIPDGWTVIDN